MNGTLIRAFLGLAVATSFVGSLQAKGPTVKLTVTGPALSRPLDITDSQLLASSGVFAGSFLGATSVEPGLSVRRYRVLFHVDPPTWMNAGVQVRYGVVYAKNSETGEGFIYLPGRGEDGYPLNVGTIPREGQVGRWHHASAKWAAALNQHVGRELRWNAAPALIESRDTSPRNA